MDYSESIIFERGLNTLFFQPVRCILLCRDTETGKNIWVKKIEDITSVIDITEDDNRYYVAFEKDYSHGEFHALGKQNGKTVWDIPGKCFLQKIFRGFLYMIFIDEKSNFHLLKVDTETGHPIWNHSVDEDLYEYHIKKYSIILRYGSGKIERIDPETGKIIIKATKN